MNTDLIRDIIERLMSSDASITEELALKVEAEVRRDWYGTQYEVAKSSPRLRAAKEQAIVADALQPELTTSEIASRHGVSRATFYRLLKRKPSATG